MKIFGLIGRSTDTQLAVENHRLRARVSHLESEVEQCIREWRKDAQRFSPHPKWKLACLQCADRLEKALQRVRATTILSDFLTKEIF